jgi:type II secretion system protein G
MKENNFKSELSEASVGEIVENEYCIWWGHSYSDNTSMEMVTVKNRVGCINIESHPLTPENIKAVITQNGNIVPLVNMNGTTSPVTKEQANNSLSGFTLVEILIIVVILAVLAAIVIPKFSNATDETKDSALDKNLQVIRQQLELYRLEHLDSYPVFLTGEASQLMYKTNVNGTTNPNGNCGPYLLAIPANPFNNKATVQVEIGSGGRGDGSHGWHFNISSGYFAADDSEHCDL